MHEHNDVGSEGYTGDRSNGLSPRFVVLGIVAVLVLVFIIENGDHVQVRVIGPRFEMPVWVVIVIAIAAGVVLDRLFVAWWRRRRDS
jgi:uncharacterized integral membrane protein